ncbi:MAG: 50S ribosomal protein L25/general stress protein Ctc [Simkaniaceae bacterium]|jgi:large subunit ribosomal protein L25|nr:50S ribosomal protein L25/general stress protein Ctc [Simkaniaceae bacterium]
MKLTVSKRAGEKKSELTKLRYQGDIPAAVYSKGKQSELIVVNGAEFSAVIRGLPKGYLPTTVFELELDGKTQKALVKDVQYHPTTYRVLHLDFMILDDKTSVDVKVPVAYVGEADCVGVKLGGFVRPIKRHVKVRCLPKDIPTDFKLSIKELGIGQSKSVGDIEFGNAIRPLATNKEIVVVIAKR